MILDKSGKLFGKISIVDLAVILAVIVVIVGIFVRFTGASKISVLPTKVRYVVKVEDVKEYTINALENKGIVTDSKTGTKIGEITDIKVEDTKLMVSNFRGELVDTVIPERYTAIVTIEGNIKKGPDGYILSDNQGLFIDHDYNIITKYVSTTGVVESIEEIS